MTLPRGAEECGACHPVAIHPILGTGLLRFETIKRAFDGMVLAKDANQIIIMISIVPGM